MRNKNNVTVGKLVIHPQSMLDAGGLQCTPSSTSIASPIFSASFLPIFLIRTMEPIFYSGSALVLNIHTWSFVIKRVGIIGNAILGKKGSSQTLILQVYMRVIQFFFCPRDLRDRYQYVSGIQFGKILFHIYRRDIDKSCNAYRYTRYSLFREVVLGWRAWGLTRAPRVFCLYWGIIIKSKVLGPKRDQVGD